MSDTQRSRALHAGVIILLIILFFILPAYPVGNLARILVLAIYAMGYNLLFGYTGLLSLGHALFWFSFAAIVKLLGIFAGVCRWHFLLMGQGIKLPF